MPRDIVKVNIIRPTRSPTATGGKVVSTVPIPNSPADGWDCRLYRVPEITVHRDEGKTGIATIDNVRRISILDLTAPVQINDLVQMPDGTNAKILRVRKYTRTLQCDLETGAE